MRDEHLPPTCMGRNEARLAERGPGERRRRLEGPKSPAQPPNNGALLAPPAEESRDDAWKFLWRSWRGGPAAGRGLLRRFFLEGNSNPLSIEGFLEI